MDLSGLFWGRWSKYLGLLRMWVRLLWPVNWKYTCEVALAHGEMELKPVVFFWHFPNGHWPYGRPAGRPQWRHGPICLRRKAAWPYIHPAKKHCGRFVLELQGRFAPNDQYTTMSVTRMRCYRTVHALCILVIYHQCDTRYLLASLQAETKLRTETLAFARGFARTWKFTS